MFIHILGMFAIDIDITKDYIHNRVLNSYSHEISLKRLATGSQVLFNLHPNHPRFCDSRAFPLPAKCFANLSFVN